MKKFYLALLSLLAIGQSASAQFNWTGQEITQNSALLITESDFANGKTNDTNTLFLYNVGTGKLVNIGGIAGKSIELNEEMGSKFWLVNNGATYLLHSSYNKPSAYYDGGNYVGYSAGATQDQILYVNSGRSTNENDKTNIDITIEVKN